MMQLTQEISSSEESRKQDDASSSPSPSPTEKDSARSKQSSSNNNGKSKASDFLDQARNHGSSDFISLDKLHELRMAFELADEDGGGGLDLDEFVNAFGHVLGSGMNQRQLTNLFMKIDANSDGSVDWAEFTEYMLLENRGSELMKKAEPKCEYLDNETKGQMEEQNHGHSKRIIRVKFVKALSAYVSCSEDGTVKLWQAHNNLKFMRTVAHRPTAPILEKKSGKEEDAKAPSLKLATGSLNSFPLKMKGSGMKPWCNDCCYMSKSSCLAVATSDRTISFYDCNIGFECVGRIRPLSSVPLHLSYYCGPNSEGREVLICADDNGFVHVWHLEPAQWSFLDTTVNIDKRAEKPVGVYRYFRHRVHDEKINQLEYDPNIGNLLSCGSDGRVQLTDIDKRRIIRSFCCHEKPVYTFVYIPRIKVVASSGADRQILFWNPYTCAIAQEIAGEDAIDSPIVKLCLNEKEHQLISLSAKSVIKVWDLSTFSCVQIVSGLGGHNESYSEMIFDRRNNHLLLCNRILTVKKAVKVEVAVRKSHLWPVVSALYNTQFHQLVSAASFEVHVWDIYTGRITFRFIHPHAQSTLTAMCFDVGGRRLITGAHDGTIKIWNFNNGACLGEFLKTSNGESLPSISDSEEDAEVTSLACFTDHVEGNGYVVSHDYIVATGRDRRVYTFSENKREVVEYASAFPLPHQVGLAHQDDVNCVIYCGAATLVTAGDDGRILVWSLSSGILKQRIGHSLLARRQLDTPVRVLEQQTTSRSKSIRCVTDTKGNNVDEEETEAEGDDDDDDNEEDEDEDISFLRSLVRKSTWADLNDLDALRKKMEQHDAKRGVTNKSKTGSYNNNNNNNNCNKRSQTEKVLEEPALPLSAREGKAKKLQMEAMQREKERKERKEKLKGVPKPDRLAVENVVYLRRLDCICSSGADGFLRFWDLKTGEMLIEFDAGHDSDESIIALACDEDSNQYLFTGDTVGFLKIWDISSISPMPLTRRGGLKIKALNSWRAHKESISSIVHLRWTESVKEPMDLIVTGSSDCSLLLWTLDGSLVGMFGQEYAWSLMHPRTWSIQKTNLVKRAKKIGEVMQNFTGFTSKMKKFDNLSQNHAKYKKMCEDHLEKDQKDEYSILKTRVRNRFKLNYLQDVRESLNEVEGPSISASQLLLQSMSKHRRKPKPSEMPHRPTLRQQLRESQVMHRMQVPQLAPVVQPSEIFSRVRSTPTL